ncbi:hypothetical protein CC1G_15027 [Coprinopsis cinerea okayama7|uniref:Uncharacterized protein n=1 Tax=Coprinopsis cinerea (strain Okayama-7 / 130 / ATCC MYA-4618 / FGSC 9003) TaxID=240176 RepID=D6RPD4_COPC7|nr:hypothetical protein CC1G_15027 [Coprinopsis cinerea okayama7\|eukprot:XP_002910696.1 hypothetical protein CC1G_15027 [Coprinopsis cinerea okayama7\
MDSCIFRSEFMINCNCLRVSASMSARGLAIKGILVGSNAT